MTHAGILQAFVVLSAESVTDDHPAHEFFRKRYETLRGEISRAFGEICAQRGSVDAPQIAATTASVTAVMDGLQVQWLLDRENVALAEASRFAIEAIAAAVLAPQPRTIFD
ncbi:TetR family transcriptional regulator C-terminal domain-containing protein [Microbacterium sp. C7(2022)]|uniref:TetR family transcriptional regulator C-terminal domain-containing protein n=1 Tax=Microbacterium sp. C7(2022) TaxID=2992759 RepID=UPI00237C25A7|nr:TetR family transcriptional regulator C-terminal domain-containing protein [Microbacterium sp. C7(2022)]MDE0547106.1 TetR family transcriptional regulator C-terminal domain-containing protein [Microbacterium sp. C7(2022)]